MFTESELLLEYGVKHAFCFKHTSINDITKIFKAKEREVISLNQCHSNICVLTKSLTNKNADGIISDNSNEILTIKTADCIPVIIFSPISKKYALLHAGWKGLFAGIIKNAIKILETSENLIAAIGPSIYKENYEVQKSFKNMFLEKHPTARGFFYPYLTNSYLFDLRSFCSSELKKYGVKKIDLIDINTYTNENFFSYREAKHQKTPLTEREQQFTVVLP